MSPRKPIQDEDLFQDSTMTFGEHLEELRACLFKAIIGLTIGFILGLCFGMWAVKLIESPLKNALTKYYEDRAEAEIDDNIDKYIKAGYSKNVAELASESHMLPETVYVNPAELLKSLDVDVPDEKNVSDEELAEDPTKQLEAVFIWRPVKDHEGINPGSLSMHEPFTIYIKTSFVLGILLSSWWIFYQIWSFVAAGLYPHEKRYVHVFLPFSIGLFFVGASLAFFAVFQPVLEFLLQFNQWLGINPEPRINDWLNFVLILPLGFGISFQLPLVMLFLERIGVFDVETYLAKWRVAVLVICIMGMLLTPADPYSMLLMACPLVVLYFGGVLLCHYMPRRDSPFDED